MKMTGLRYASRSWLRSGMPFIPSLESLGFSGMI